MDGDDYTWEELPPGYHLVGDSPRQYDSRTCAERHADQAAALMSRVQLAERRLEKLTAKVMQEVDELGVIRTRLMAMEAVLERWSADS